MAATVHKLLSDELYGNKLYLRNNVIGYAFFPDQALVADLSIRLMHLVDIVTGPQPMVLPVWAVLVLAQLSLSCNPEHNFGRTLNGGLKGMHKVRIMWQQGASPV